MRYYLESRLFSVVESRAITWSQILFSILESHTMMWSHALFFDYGVTRYYLESDSIADFRG